LSRLLGSDKDCDPPDWCLEAYCFPGLPQGVRWGFRLCCYPKVQAWGKPRPKRPAVPCCLWLRNPKFG
jgi:hypothetical protein